MRKLALTVVERVDQNRGIYAAVQECLLFLPHMYIAVPSPWRQAEIALGMCLRKGHTFRITLALASTAPAVVPRFISASAQREAS